MKHLKGKIAVTALTVATLALPIASSQAAGIQSQFYFGNQWPGYSGTPSCLKVQSQSQSQVLSQNGYTITYSNRTNSCATLSGCTGNSCSTAGNCTTNACTSKVGCTNSSCPAGSTNANGSCPVTTNPGGQSTGTSPSTEDYTPAQASAQEQAAWKYINEDRQQNNRTTLPLDQELSRLARMKSLDMLTNKYFAHTSPTLGSAAQMLKDNGYSFSGVGENIAHHANVLKAHAAFMSSSGHRQNILGSQWTKVGVGVVLDANGYIYETQLFAR